MADYDFSTTRLHVEADLAEGVEVALEGAQANYLRNVLRMAAGDGVLLFNGRDGEWGGRIAAAEKKRVTVACERLLRPQTPANDLVYLFAPLKHARLDYMVQKAVEMGAGRLVPVITRRTEARRVNLERMRANVVEAAEQCGVLSVPAIDDPVGFDPLLDGWDVGRTLVFCDEAAEVADPVAALAPHAGRPLAVLIGPEGGFDPVERERLVRLAATVRISLGPRILRADTAAVAALALVQAIAGDGRG